MTTRSPARIIDLRLLVYRKHQGVLRRGHVQADDIANLRDKLRDPVGHLTTETSYSGGAAYVIQQKAVNNFGESLGETVTIPSAAGTLAGTYTFGHTYTSGTGLPLNDTYPAAGGLPAETVIHSYEGNADLPKARGGSIDAYAQNTGYDAYGDVLTEIIGGTVASSNQATITNIYDPHTLRLTESAVTRAGTTPRPLTTSNTPTTCPATSPGRSPTGSGHHPPSPSASPTTRSTASPRHGPPPTAAPPTRPPTAGPPSATASAPSASTGLATAMTCSAT